MKNGRKRLKTYLYGGIYTYNSLEDELSVKLSFSNI